jgi:hypothetical protein
MIKFLKNFRPKDRGLLLILQWLISGLLPMLVLVQEHRLELVLVVLSEELPDRQHTVLERLRVLRLALVLEPLKLRVI